MMARISGYWPIAALSIVALLTICLINLTRFVPNNLMLLVSGMIVFGLAGAMASYYHIARKPNLLHIVCVIGFAVAFLSQSAWPARKPEKRNSPSF